MGVIINDFEVIVDEPRAAETETAAQGEESRAPAPALTPEDLEAVQRHQEQRMARIRAH